MDGQPRDSRKAPLIPGYNVQASGNRGSCDQEIVRSNGVPARSQLQPKTRMRPGRNQIERQNWKTRDKSLDEGPSTRPTIFVVRSVRTIEELRGRDGSKSEVDASVLLWHLV